MYPKFVLTADGHVRLGMVTLHRHLLLPGDKCLGGGYYAVDYQSCSLVLSGSSADYGAPRWGEVVELILPDGYRGMPLLYDYGGSAPQHLNATHRVSYE